MRPEDQHFRWRCRHCRVVSLLDGNGGNLHCVCGMAHTDFEFMVDIGRLADGQWHPASDALIL